MRPLLLLALLTACTPKALESDDADLDGVSDSEDCAPDDPAIFPGAVEVCNGLDDDCDGSVDEEALDAPVWFVDGDGDGWGDDQQRSRACVPPTAAVEVGGDCDDTDTAFYPGAPEDDCTDPNDYNCDGSVGWADEDGDGWAACEECDDTDPDVNPDADEVCNEVDDDCDGSVDEEPVDGQTWYHDTDGDDYGDAGDWRVECEQPDRSWVLDSTDCDDDDATAWPGADEHCDGADNDCDGTIDEDDAVDPSTWYADSDGDTYGDLASTDVACDRPSGYVADFTDCDDTDDEVYPGADEYCDGEDDDCDGTIDEDDAVDASTWYADSDGDTYGDANSFATACEQPTGYVDDDQDCDDTDDTVNPGETDWCDGVDNDCSGDEDGLVSYTASGGGQTNLSATFASGTSSSPASLVMRAGDFAICPGTYYVHLSTSASVDLVGPYGASVTVLDGGDADNVLAIASSSGTVTAHGLTLQAGYGTNGGVIASTDTNLDLSLTDSVVSSGSADYGGGIYLDGGTLTATDCTFLDNYASTSGGGIFAESADLALDGCTFTTNEAAGGGGEGGAGLYSETGDVDLVDCEFDTNDASGNDGGAALVQSGSLTASGCSFHDNSAYDWGGALCTHDGADFALEDCLLEDNTADDGGAVYVLDGSLSCTVTGSGTYGALSNSATTVGGAVFLEADESTVSLSSTGCDWGSSHWGDDNSPEDIASASFTATYGHNATFSCDDSSCTP